MPQLDVSTFFSQIFWFLIFFSFLFFVVGCIFLPRLCAVLNARSSMVLGPFNSSVYLLKIAEEQVAMYNTALDQAKFRAKKIMDDAFVQVEEMRANVKSILEKEEKEIAKIVEERVVEFKSKYVSELKQIATGIALIYYAKLTNSKIKEEFIADFILKEF